MNGKLLNGLDSGIPRIIDHLGQKEFLRFLVDTSAGEIPLYVSYRGTFIYSAFLPQDCLKGKYVDDLMNWDYSPGRSWEYCYSPGRHRALKTVPVLSPLEFSKSGILKKATPIVILRNFEGMAGSYIVVNQLLSHPNDLHFEKQRSAYCRLNGGGGVEEVIRISRRPGEDLVTITQEVLDKHLFLTKSVLLRLFDRGLLNDRTEFAVSRRKSRLHDVRNKIFATTAFDNNLPEAGRLRGFQIIRSRLSQGEGARLLTGVQRIRPGPD